MNPTVSIPARAEAEGGPPTPLRRDLRILLVDDDPAIGEALSVFFELFGWHLLADETGEEGLERMKQDPSLDLILLDVHLPGMDGFELLERSQEAGVVAPVVMLSTNAQDQARLRALGLGAQDYFVKPFDPEALKARIEMLTGLAPTPALAHPRIHIGGVTVDLDEERVYRDGEAVELSEVQFDLLRVLVENRGEAVSRKRLLKDAWSIDRDALTFTITLKVIYESLDKHIEFLRELIEPNPHDPVYLETVYGQGYRLREA